MTENEISYAIRGAAFEVIKKLGPGLLESIYEAALAHELRKRNMEVSRQVEVPVYYDGKNLGIGLRLDLLVADKVIVELKSVEQLHPIHFKQVTTYLKITGKKLGLLINFNTERLKDKESICRIVNDL